MVKKSRSASGEARFFSTTFSLGTLSLLSRRAFGRGAEVGYPCRRAPFGIDPIVARHLCVATAMLDALLRGDGRSLDAAGGADGCALRFDIQEQRLCDQILVCTSLGVRFPGRQRSRLGYAEPAPGRERSRQAQAEQQ